MLDDLLFVGPLDPPDGRLSRPEGPAPCDTGFSTRITQPEPVLLSVEGGGTEASTATGSSARSLLRFDTILKE